MRNQEKISLLAEGLSTLTPREAMAVVGTINHTYGLTVSRGVVHLLAEAVQDPEGSADAVTGKLTLVGCGERKIHVIKVLREHLEIGLREAKGLSEATPVVLDNKYRERGKLSGAQKLALAHALQGVGAVVEFK
jgi:ribosomal protein L7/L12